MVAIFHFLCVGQSHVMYSSWQIQQRVNSPTEGIQISQEGSIEIYHVHDRWEYNVPRKFKRIQKSNLVHAGARGVAVG
jgi:hypothetical protein